MSNMRISSTPLQPGPWYSEGDFATLQQGESLPDLAKRLGVSEKALIVANPQIDPKKLAAGQNVNIPKHQATGRPSGDEKAQASPQKTDSNAGARLSELNLQGQLQQLRIRGAEGSGEKAKVRETGPTKVDGKHDGSDPSPVGPEELKRREAGDVMFRGPGRELKKMGVDLDKESLLRAVRLGNRKALELFMKADPKLTKKCFLETVKTGNTKLVGEFLRAGMNPNIRDEQFRTPLMLAGNPDIVDMLINRGADVTAKDKLKRTVLMYQAQDGYITLKLREKVKESGTIDARDINGKTALMYAAGSDVGEMNELIIAGADVNAVDKNRMTALGYAAASGNVFNASKLMEEDADPNGWAGGEIPLNLAISNGNKEMVQALLDNRYTLLDLQNPLDGKTFLDLAIEMGRQDIVDLLRNNSPQRAHTSEELKLMQRLRPKQL
ncbi:ankyrin repeat domain-containing protein [bacterium]|nr:ankyrin repeat domain-containing protein [bacterium]